jgi:hypothetical protein
MPSFFLLTMDGDRQEFMTYLPVPPPSSTWGRDRTSGQHVREAFGNG